MRKIPLSKVFNSLYLNSITTEWCLIHDDNDCARFKSPLDQLTKRPCLTVVSAPSLCRAVRYISLNVADAYGRSGSSGVGRALIFHESHSKRMGFGDQTLPHGVCKQNVLNLQPPSPHGPVRFHHISRTPLDIALLRYFSCPDDRQKGTEECAKLLT